MPPVIGTRLGPYKILAPLGEGGMGEVYRARDTRLGRDVAIKVLPDRLSKDPRALARFEREAKAVAALSHPNILSIFDVGVDQGGSYVVSELLEGDTLRTRLTASAIPWRKASEIGAAIADGLSAAHSKGITHRDLKPENIFLTSDSRVKILDFGLARIKPALSSEDETLAPPETEAGTILGTVGYMSPEQVRGGAADAPSDIFSLGCVLYEMIAGRRAFARDTAVQTMSAILETDPPPLADCGSLHPPELDRIITRCLEKNPGERLQSARDLSFTLRALTSTHDPILQHVTPESAFPLKPLALVAGTALLIIAIVIGMNVGGLRNRLTTRSSPSRIESLAVLPLGNISGDPSQEYFADGMTEALISNLAQIRALKVISRTSVMRYKGTTKSLPEIARDLGVDAIVEGSVQRAGDRVRITAQLIHGATDRHLWAKEYEGEMSNILRLESDVARAIAREIRIQVTPEDNARLGKARSVSPEAQEAYLKGRYFWNKRTGESLKMAKSYFEAAIAKDATYAAAYAGLADCYLITTTYTAVAPRDSFPKAREAALTALRIDDTLVEALATLGRVTIFYDWDWAGAEALFKRIFELDPSYATAHQWYAWDLLLSAKAEDAIAEMAQAQKLDPLSVPIGTDLGNMFFFSRRYTEAREQYRKILLMEPNFGQAHLFLGSTYLQESMHQDAVLELQTAVQLVGSPAAIAALGQAHAASGNIAEARRILADVLERSKRSYFPSEAIATIYVSLGDRDRAFEWLLKSVEQREAPTLKIDPAYDPIRSDPRFADLLRRVNLSP